MWSNIEEEFLFYLLTPIDLERINEDPDISQKISPPIQVISTN